MSEKEYKYSVVYKIWNKAQDKFITETKTLNIFKEMNSKEEISKVMLVHTDEIISFEEIK